MDNSCIKNQNLIYNVDIYGTCLFEQNITFNSIQLQKQHSYGLLKYSYKIALPGIKCLNSCFICRKKSKSGQ